jgi:protein TonB
MGHTYNRLRAMKIKHLLVMAAFLSSGTSFGADDASAQSSAPTTAKTSSVAKAKAKSKTKPKTKPKAKTKKKAVKKKAAPKVKKPAKAAEAPDADPVVIAAATNLYKKELAEKIVKTSPAKVYGERPQALLRSVVVLEFLVDADGKLLSSSVRRSNDDPAADATALASLREAAPLPKPPAILVRHGPITLHETWLFNKDGRFQIRSTAQQQLDR